MLKAALHITSLITITERAFFLNSESPGYFHMSTSLVSRVIWAPSSTTHPEQADNSLTSRMLTQSCVPLPGPYAALPGACFICSSMSGVILFSPDFFLTLQPS